LSRLLNLNAKAGKVKRNWRTGKLLLLIPLFSTSLMAQTGNSRPVSTVFAVLTNSLESRNAVAGQQLTLRSINDVVVGGEIVIPRGSNIIGQVTDVITKGKDRARSGLAIVIEKAVTKNGTEIPVQAIIAAVAAPKDGALSSDPAYGMMHSNEPKMTSSGLGTVAGTGTLPPSSKASSTAAVATADLKGRMDEPFLLDENSQGAIGYEGLSLSWSFASPPPFTVFASKSKNFRLETGTQMMLRMVPPRPAK
jgi:hypothetical protein